MLSDVQNLTTVITQQCHEMLFNFVADHGLLYNEYHVKPVVEDVTHTGPQCFMFWPLVNYDAFGFESVNGFFHELINGNRNIHLYPMDRLGDSKTIDQINIFDKEAKYVKHGYYTCNQLLRSELITKKHKIYTDTVVQINYNNVKEAFHIKLILLSNYC
ncbi:unnamed protein product [Didymodactylos carnosus]|uniref:Uncharacterized protein n=1 Tax=Didymodactylos carnosus TaxID=1234261 RepID=A0A8S2SQI9_9BILA|nr:unnamed protein product [Didymodactylos carnosus]CAF4236624.1 unnamed protein product [Didymodactylos carnosus]